MASPPERLETKTDLPDGWETVKRGPARGLCHHTHPTDCWQATGPAAFKSLHGCHRRDCDPTRRRLCGGSRRRDSCRWWGGEGRSLHTANEERAMIQRETAIVQTSIRGRRSGPSLTLAT